MIITSIIEAKLLALKYVTKEVIVLKRFFKEINLDLREV
jgi:hypothetical protein